MEKLTLTDKDLDLYCKGETDYNTLVRIISSVLRDRYQVYHNGRGNEDLPLKMTPEINANVEYEAVWLARQYQEAKNEKEG